MRRQRSSSSLDVASSMAEGYIFKIEKECHRINGIQPRLLMLDTESLTRELATTPETETAVTFDEPEQQVFHQAIARRSWVNT